MDKLNSDERKPDPEAKAKELTRLAESSDDPGERAWYLQWARAFQRLAQLSGRERPPSHRGDH